MPQLLQLPMGPRGKTISNVIKYGGLLVVGLIVSPFIMAAIGGLIGLAVMIGLYSVAVAFQPWFSLKLANLATRFLIQEIRENPVESRIKVYNEKFAELNQGKDDLLTFNGEVEKFRVRLENLKKNYPEDVPKFLAQLQTMEKLLQLRYAGFKQAEAKLEEYAKMTNRVKAIWEMTQASDQMAKAAGKLGQDTALMQIINDESIRAAEDGMARSFAQLDHLLRMEEIQEEDLKVVPIDQPKMLEKAEDGAFILPSLTVKRSTQLAKVA